MARQVLDNGVILPSEYSDDWYDDMTLNLTKLDEVIGSDAEKLDESDVGEAAISNDYDDLDNKPAYNVLRRAAVTLTAGGTGNYSDLDSISKIKAGDYVLDAANKLYSITAIDTANSTYTVSAAAIINITDKSELGAAALSNSYDDLNNLPSYGVTRLVNTAITDNSNVSFANISSVSKIAAGDFLLDTAGKMYVIASVDTANETAAVTTPVTQLALDAFVVHVSGNETIAGEKTFSSNLTSPGLRSISSTEISGQGSNILSLYSTLVFLNGDPSITARLNFRILGSDGSKSLYPHETGQYVLGLTSRRYANTWTNAINTLNPGAMSMPDLSSGLDISAYITLDTVSSYTPSVDGFISVRLSGSASNGVYIEQGNFATSGRDITENNIRYSRCCMPVVKNQTVNILCKSGNNVDYALFYPCLGNV